MYTRILQLFLVGAVALGLAACPGDDSPQVLSFSYRFVPLTEAEAIQVSQELAQGAIDFSDPRLQGRERCGYVANFDASTVPTPPRLRFNGTPGQPGSNFSVQGLEPIPTTAPCEGTPARQATGISVLSGQPVVVGQDLDCCEGEVFFPGDNFRSDNLYFRTRVDSFDSTSGRTRGAFEFLARNANDPTDPRTLVVTDGTFLMNAQ